ncbi:MAG: hypothetical protein Q7J98_07060 [Kiritimatiellia bacterium]|nr:hypothetical protein [Kiritimatiellia bacterium]
MSFPRKRESSEAPRGTCLGGADRQSRKPRGIFARLGGAFRLRGSAKRRYGATTVGEAWAEPCEAQNAIPPCGKPQGFLAKKGKKSFGFWIPDQVGNDRCFHTRVQLRNSL